ncbi:hypothetical protein DYQ86_07235 [Acidobacteria bacterium AB60]|nr:hypothetical protein DYQ86_07235 [Acidobacteria bacterium AB60]
MVWLILVFNIATVIVAGKKHVLPYAILMIETIFLVTGQAIEIQADLKSASFTTYAYSRITDSGFERALWYVMMVSILSLLLALFARGYLPPPRLSQEYRFLPSNLFYLLLLSFESAVALILIVVVVGVSAFLTQSRPGAVPGATLFIVLMSVGLFPMFLKLAYKSRVQPADWLCFLISLGVTAGFSRLHVILYSFILLIVLYYRRGWVERPITLRMVSAFVFSGALLAAFFVVFGALRDAQNYTHGSIRDLIQYNLDHPEKSVLYLDVTYRLGVEGMSGLAGALSDAQADPVSVHRDYGIQIVLDGISQLLPSALKQVVSEQIEEIQDWYWYKKPPGNVSPGLETSFVSFGWLGIPVYVGLVFLFGWVFPMKIFSSNPTPPLMLCFLMAVGCTPLMVRGKLSTWFGFSLAYSVVILLVWPLFANCFSRLPSQESA